MRLPYQLAVCVWPGFFSPEMHPPANFLRPQAVKIHKSYKPIIVASIKIVRRNCKKGVIVNISPLSQLLFCFCCKVKRRNRNHEELCLNYDIHFYIWLRSNVAGDIWHSFMYKSIAMFYFIILSVFPVIRLTAALKKEVLFTYRVLPWKGSPIYLCTVG